MNLSIFILTGSTKASKRKEIHEKLENGEIQILIGTHALLEDKVKFKNLGLAIIDEQHRFGVAQRSKLWHKNKLPPHVLVMTATPIPRTLAMSVYGDLDISIIDELPPGRKEIKTVHRFDANRLKVFRFLKDEISKGRQVYIVYPLIQESEALDYIEKNEFRLKEQFLTDIETQNKDFWFWASLDQKLYPKLLGYAMGYKICKNFYEIAPNKTAALLEIMNIQDAETFLKSSGYFIENISFNF